MTRAVAWFLSAVVWTILLWGVLLAQPTAPPLTEVEALKVQNLNLERVILERQVADWTAKQAKLKSDIESARPGWVWNAETGKFTAKETQ
jgi:hypothetical protein